MSESGQIIQHVIISQKKDETNETFSWKAKCSSSYSKTVNGYLLAYSLIKMKCTQSLPYQITKCFPNLKPANLSNCKSIGPSALEFQWYTALLMNKIQVNT